MIERTPRERLYWLLDLLLAGELSIAEFVREFGRTFSVDLDVDELTVDEYRAFERVYMNGEWYAPDEERRASPSGWKSEADIVATARAAKDALRPLN